MASFVKNCKSNLGLTLVVLVLLPTLISLGVWQLQRAETTRLATASLASRMALPALDYKALVNSDMSDFEYRTIELMGRFDSERYWLLDNRSYEGKTGYDIIVPFKVSALKDVTLLVNLGWLPASAKRDELPSVSINTDKTTITGTLRSPIVNAIYSDMASDLDVLWPQRVLSVNITTASTALDATVPSLLLKIQPKHPQAYTDNWPVVTVSAAKNHGYAIQWFAMACVLLIIFIIINRPQQQVKE